MKFFPIAALICTLCVTGCALEKYQSVNPHFTKAARTAEDADVIVLLESVFPGKPFSEIVSDNAVGVSWSPEESRHIGFTQHYASTLAKNAPQIAMLASLPTNQRIGMSASGDTKPLNIDSRILVPFGRFIHDNLVEAVGINGKVCEDSECLHKAMAERPKARLISVQFTKLQVAEQARNMLMLEVEGVATVTHAGVASGNIAIYSKVNRSITSEGMWHSDFLRAMNNIANESSSAIAAQIVPEKL